MSCESRRDYRQKGKMMTKDLGILLLRVAAGLMILGHGIGKVSNLFGGDPRFPDPLGIGVIPSLALAAFAEFLCAILVIVGFKTRFAAIPLVINMAVAVLVVHAGDPWGDKELAVLYGAAFLTLVITGGGKFTVGLGLGKWMQLGN